MSKHVNILVIARESLPILFLASGIRSRTTTSSTPWPSCHENRWPSYSYQSLSSFLLLVFNKYVQACVNCSLLLLCYHSVFALPLSLFWLPLQLDASPDHVCAICLHKLFINQSAVDFTAFGFYLSRHLALHPPTL